MYGVHTKRVDTQKQKKNKQIFEKKNHWNYTENYYQSPKVTTKHIMSNSFNPQLYKPHR